MHFKVPLSHRRRVTWLVTEALLLILTISLRAPACAAQPDAKAPDQSTQQRVGFTNVLQCLAYLLMVGSTVQLCASGVALLQMPRPRCLCYTMPYSDTAVCCGTPCCSCANIRQLNATMLLIWSLLLMCQLATGSLRSMFLYPYLGFCALHCLTLGIMHHLARSYRRQAVVMEEATDNQMALRLAMNADGARLGAAAPHPAVPHIHTLSAELVMVLQPDYGCYSFDNGSSSAAAAAAAGGGDLVRCSGSAAAAAAAAAGVGQRRASGGQGADGAEVAGSRGGGGSSGRGVSWALRYTRMDSLPATAAPKFMPPWPTTSRGVDVAWAAATAAATATAAAAATAAEDGTMDTTPRASATATATATAAAANGGGGGGGGGFDRLQDVQEPSTRRGYSGPLAAAATSLWRTTSDSPWGLSSVLVNPMAWPAARPATTSPISPTVDDGAAGRRRTSCDRTASAGLPVRQASAGSGTAPTSSPSYSRICGTLSKRSSPAAQQQQQQQQLPYHALLRYPPPPPPGGSPLPGGSPVQGGSPPPLRATASSATPPRPPLPTVWPGHRRGATSATSAPAAAAVSYRPEPRLEAASLPTVPVSPLSHPSAHSHLSFSPSPSLVVHGSSPGPGPSPNPHPSSHVSSEQTQPVSGFAGFGAASYPAGGNGGSPGPAGATAGGSVFSTPYPGRAAVVAFGGSGGGGGGGAAFRQGSLEEMADLPARPPIRWGSVTLPEDQAV